jgi:hypothetical protein
VTETDSSGLFYSKFIHDYRIADTACVAVRLIHEIWRLKGKHPEDPALFNTFKTAARELFPDLSVGDRHQIAMNAFACFADLAEIPCEGEA